MSSDSCAMQIIAKNASVTFHALHDSAIEATGKVKFLEMANARELDRLNEMRQEYDQSVIEQNYALSKALAICDLLTQIEPTNEDGLPWRECFDLDRDP